MAAAADQAETFTQMVEFTAKSMEDREKLVDAWRVATAFVVKEEKGTLTHTYEIYLPKRASNDVDARQVMALETYNSKAELDAKHMRAAPISGFIARAGELMDKVELNFLRPVAGFLSRGAAKEEEVRASGIKPHCLVVTVNFASNEALTKFLPLLTAVTAHTFSAEPRTLSYQLYSATQTPVPAGDSSSTQLRLFERYQTEADLTENHMQSAPFKAMQAAIAAADPSMKPTGPPGLRFYDELAIGFVGDV